MKLYSSRIRGLCACASLRVVGLLVLCGMVSSTPAGVLTGTVRVSAIYNTSCTLNTLGDWDFGYLGAGGSTTTAAAVSQRLGMVCTNGTTYGLWITPGDNVSSGQRRMRNSESSSTSRYLNYNMSLVDGGTAVPSTTTSTGNTGTGGMQYIGIAASIPAGQTLYAGTYVDNIVVTLSF